jgi:RHS repeat-associated protein
VDSTGTRNYVCEGAEVASTVLSDGAAVYSDGSEHRSGASSFRHTDALGSTRGITNSSQTATDGILLDAFGMTVSRTGSTPTPFGFVGSEQYQSDPDSGLMLLGHRYYDPSIGRFITSDPVQDGDNWYAYCGNDPLGRVDPSGLQGGLLPPGPGGVPRIPPGYDDTWGHGTDGRGDYVENPDGGSRWYPHPKDKSHWDHYDWGYPDDDGNPPDRTHRFPKKSVKPWPGQKKRFKPDQSPTDPWERVIQPAPSDPSANRDWWQYVDWGDVMKDLVVGVGSGIIILNPEIWPALPIIAPGLVPALAH